MRQLWDVQLTSAEGKFGLFDYVARDPNALAPRVCDGRERGLLGTVAVDGYDACTVYDGCSVCKTHGNWRGERVSFRFMQDGVSQGIGNEAHYDPPQIGYPVRAGNPAVLDVVILIDSNSEFGTDGRRDPPNGVRFTE